MDVTPFYKDCVFDVCANPEGKDVCDNAKAYVDACADVGYDVTDWRSEFVLLQKIRCTLKLSLLLN